MKGAAQAKHRKECEGAVIPRDGEVHSCRLNVRPSTIFVIPAVAERSAAESGDPVFQRWWNTGSPISGRYRGLVGDDKCGERVPDRSRSMSVGMRSPFYAMKR